MLEFLLLIFVGDGARDNQAKSCRHSGDHNCLDGNIPADD